MLVRQLRASFTSEIKISHHVLNVYGAEEAPVGEAKEAAAEADNGAPPKWAAEDGRRGGLIDTGGAVRSNDIAAALDKAVGSVRAVDSDRRVSVMAPGCGWRHGLEFGEKTVEVGLVLAVGSVVGGSRAEEENRVYL